MRAFCLLSIPLLLIAQTIARAQTGGHDSWTIGAGSFFTSGSNRNVTAQFPYTVIPSNGAAFPQTFAGKLDKSYFSNPLYMINLSNLEFDRKNHGIDVGLGLFEEHGGEHGFYLQGGYRRLFPVGPFVLKPGVDAFVLIGNRKKIGSIDNKDNEIDIGQTRAYPQYDVETTTDDYSQTNTYDAYHLNIEYSHTGFLLEPKIVLGTNPIHKFSVSLETGWMFQIGQESTLEFVQTDSKDNNPNTAGSVKVGHNGDFSGPYVALNFGLSFGVTPARH